MTCSRPQRNVHRPGFEPGTPWSEIRRSNHCATPPPVVNGVRLFCLILPLLSNMCANGTLLSLVLLHMHTVLSTKMVDSRDSINQIRRVDFLIGLSIGRFNFQYLGCLVVSYFYSSSNGRYCRPIINMKPRCRQCPGIF